jgi:hypothetical protein
MWLSLTLHAACVLRPPSARAARRGGAVHSCGKVGLVGVARVCGGGTVERRAGLGCPLPEEGARRHPAAWLRAGRGRTEVHLLPCQWVGGWQVVVACCSVLAWWRAAACWPVMPAQLCELWLLGCLGHPKP